MRHAILIMAHKEVEHLCQLVSYFTQACDVFIHMDKKKNLTPQELATIKGHKQVKFLSQKYVVNWGGTSVLDCELFLLQKAMEESDADYFHLISGQDYPTRPLQEFLHFFEQNADKEFLQYISLPHPNWEDCTFRRLQYFYPYDQAPLQPNPRQWVQQQVRQQVARGIKRPIPDEFDHLYGSSQWFSISRKGVSTLLEYTRNHPSLYRRMWMTFAPEECYVATVLVNLLEKDSIVPSNLRFIRWQKENGNRPANLGKEHFHFLLEQEYFFARKMERPYCEELLPLVNKYLLADTEVQQTHTGGWIYDGYRQYEYEEAFCNWVTRFCQDVNIKSAIDMGCGAGYYVAQWRRRCLPFCGYDANPYTPALSSRLLAEGETPCGIADLTDTLHIECPFELVVCKDVLPYIPSSFEPIAFHNLAALSTHFILLSWEDTSSTIGINSHPIKEQDLLTHFEQEDFVVERYMTALLRLSLKRKDCCLLIKKGLQLRTE